MTVERPSELQDKNAEKNFAFQTHERITLGLQIKLHCDISPHYILLVWRTSLVAVAQLMHIPYFLLFKRTNHFDNDIAMAREWFAPATERLATQ